MSNTNTTNRGIGQTLHRVAHSVKNWFEALCSFSDSSDADTITAGIAEMRRQYTQERQALPVRKDQGKLDSRASQAQAA